MVQQGDFVIRFEKMRDRHKRFDPVYDNAKWF